MRVSIAANVLNVVTIQRVAQVGTLKFLNKFSASDNYLFSLFSSVTQTESTPLEMFV